MVPRINGGPDLWEIGVGATRDQLRQAYQATTFDGGRMISTGFGGKEKLIFTGLQSHIFKIYLPLLIPPVYRILWGVWSRESLQQRGPICYFRLLQGKSRI
ncbi:hypothetical protein Pyn_11854 [Prunus yedoensis var. nudiflora]|uniref:Uncharacterized protein n=1 Tax=Prunus yedoensis var. nudiflora TaxID=2094558 RepID=A0A314YXN4_PRUYE|nr:hypothetical protein Pyn_11854 [Prunus yedoensis var. nudiflora]